MGASMTEQQAATTPEQPRRPGEADEDGSRRGAMVRHLAVQGYEAQAAALAPREGGPSRAEIHTQARQRQELLHDTPIDQMSSGELETIIKNSQGTNRFVAMDEVPEGATNDGVNFARTPDGRWFQAVDGENVPFARWKAAKDRRGDMSGGSLSSVRGSQFAIGGRGGRGRGREQRTTLQRDGASVSSRTSTNDVATSSERQGGAYSRSDFQQAASRSRDLAAAAEREGRTADAARHRGDAERAQAEADERAPDRVATEGRLVTGGGDLMRRRHLAQGGEKDQDIGAGGILMDTAYDVGAGGAYAYNVGVSDEGVSADVGAQFDASIKGGLELHKDIDFSWGGEDVGLKLFLKLDGMVGVEAGAKLQGNFAFATKKEGDGLPKLDPHELAAGTGLEWDGSTGELKPPERGAHAGADLFAGVKVSVGVGAAVEWKKKAPAAYQDKLQAAGDVVLDMLATINPVMAYGLEAMDGAEAAAWVLGKLFEWGAQDAVPLVAAEATLEASAGAGVSAQAALALNGTGLTVGVNGNATAGLGAGVDTKLTFDVVEGPKFFLILMGEWRQTFLDWAAEQLADACGDEGLLHDTLGWVGTHHQVIRAIEQGLHEGLPAEARAEMITTLVNGPTPNEDEQAILAICRFSKGHGDLAEVLGYVDYEDLKASMHGDEWEEFVGEASGGLSEELQVDALQDILSGRVGNDEEAAILSALEAANEAGRIVSVIDDVGLFTIISAIDFADYERLRELLKRTYYMQISNFDGGYLVEEALQHGENGQEVIRDLFAISRGASIAEMISHVGLRTVCEGLDGAEWTEIKGWLRGYAYRALDYDQTYWFLDSLMSGSDAEWAEEEAIEILRNTDWGRFRAIVDDFGRERFEDWFDFSEDSTFRAWADQLDD